MDALDRSNLPKHIAIIMDGNGRWAEKRGATRTFGHENAFGSVQSAVEGCLELNIPYLTLYAFSTENWSRPKTEINVLMRLMVDYIKKSMRDMVSQGIHLRCIGDISALPVLARSSLESLIASTASNRRLSLTLALNYSGRWDIVQATRSLVRDALKGNCGVDDINESRLGSYMALYPIPDPELLIRTSGEMRISNFLLWQLAYTELYVTEVLWPDFRKKDLYAALLSYQRRERRFGTISAASK